MSVLRIGVGTIGTHLVLAFEQDSTLYDQKCTKVKKIHRVGIKRLYIENVVGHHHRGAVSFGER